MSDGIVVVRGWVSDSVGRLYTSTFEKGFRREEWDSWDDRIREAIMKEALWDSGVFKFTWEVTGEEE